jgi:hypothetical protein
VTVAPAPVVTEHRPRWWHRLTVAIVAGAVAALVVAVSLGLPAAPAGAGDNGDGPRLYCGAGLLPLTADGRSNWKGGVVLAFATGKPACPDPIVSSALPMLRLATVGSGATWSLARLGLLYAVAVGLVTALAAWALGPALRLVVLLPPLVPLAGLTFSRFFVSTFSEPAGLLGTYALLLGAAVVAATDRTERPERSTGLLLIAAGGVLAATAKTSYLPLLAVAAVLSAATAVQIGARPGRRDRWVGLAVAAMMVVLAVAPVLASLKWQERRYAAVNAHNLIFTAVLPGVGDAALAPLGLPAAAEAFAGRAYYPAGTDGVPGASAIAADPARARVAAYRVLAAHPLVAAGAVGLGMAATLGAGLTYLPSAPLTPTSVGPPLGTTVGEQGAYHDQLQSWLDGLAVPWLPLVVAFLGVVLGILTVRRGSPLVRALSLLSALAAVSAVVLVTTAVVGDGFFEIAKHVWLSAYLLEVTAAAAVLAGIVACGERVVRLRSAASEPASESSTESR